uniref:Uncharacterized protein n=1 Tax=Panagrolaimus sp. JU765 TaxID=591449 RepID=A0AC34RKZ0_9BILA
MFAKENEICFEVKIGPTYFEPKGTDKLGHCLWNRQVIGKLSVDVRLVDYLTAVLIGVDIWEDKKEEIGEVGDQSGVIIGVVAGIGALAAIIIIPVAIYCYLKKKGNNEQDKKPEQEVSRKVSTPTVDNNRDVMFNVG